MRAAVQRLVRGALVLLAVGVAACSTLRFTYSQGPTLAYWWLDGYADFTPEQAPVAKAAVRQWFDWHRRTQLPDYQALLDRAEREVQVDATPAQACSWWATLQKRRDVALAQMVPPLAQLAPRLQPAQLEHMQAKFERSNDKWRDDHLQPNLARRERAAVDRAVEQAERLYGRLTRAQRDFLATLVRSSPADPERWLAMRQQQQRDTLHTLQQVRGMAPEQARPILTAWMTRLAEGSDPDMAADRDAVQAHWCAGAAQLHNRTNSGQREHAVQALRGWHEDLASLHAAAALTAAPSL